MRSYSSSLAFSVSLVSLILLAPLTATKADPPAAAQTASAATAAVPTDAKAEALLLQVHQKLTSLRSLTANTEKIYRYPARDGKPARTLRDIGVARALKPNLVYLNYNRESQAENGEWKPIPSAPSVYASDGKTSYVVFSDMTYRQQPADPTGKKVHISDNRLLQGFFNADISPYSQFTESKKDGSLTGLRYDGKEKWEGQDYDVVVLSQKSTYAGETYTGSLRYFIGSDALIHRIVNVFDFDGRGMETEYLYRNLKPNAKQEPKDFTYAPPKEAKPYKEPERQPLLAVGTEAPDFTVQDKDGKPLKLSDFRGKVVVLDFWATWCGPCISSFPHTAQVAKKVAPQGAVVLAVNVWDSKEEFDKWLPEHKEYADAFTFAIDTTKGPNDIATKLYKVSGIPTQYVIDREGRITASFVGFGGPTDDLEKAIAKADTKTAQNK